MIMAGGPTITVADIAPRHLRPGAESDSYSGPLSPPRRRASDRAASVSGDNGSATVLGMTRDQLFEAFSRFVSARVEAKARAGAPVDVGSSDDNGADGEDDSGGKVVADRAEPAKAHAKAKPKKKR